MSDRVEINGLSVDRGLYDLVDEIIPGSGVESGAFWQSLADIVTELGPQNREFLQQRDQLQTDIDTWHKNNPAPFQFEQYKDYLQEIGYLVPESEPFQVTTENVDDEIALIAGPQLVVPVDNARYALNAANARWYSLYDALYGTDIILEVEGCKKTARYNPVRGQQVIRYARDFLDQAVPLATGSHAYAVRYKVVSGKLIVVMGDGSTTELGWRECFVGYRGDPEQPSAVLLRNNKDSVSAVDAEDKIRVYRNWFGLMKGHLTAQVARGKETIERSLNPDPEFIAPDGSALKLPGRSLMLVRNVGTHMYTDAVTCNGEEIPETFLDAMVTALAARHDLLGNGPFRNSRTGSVYIVKPKIHGPAEVEAAIKLFGMVEAALGMEPHGTPDLENRHHG
jgi:malate synthase